MNKINEQIFWIIIHIDRCMIFLNLTFDSAQGSSKNTNSNCIDTQKVASKLALWLCYYHIEKMS